MARQPPTSERRATRRVAVAIDAVLYYNTVMLPECYVRDLSPEGAFIATRGHFLPDQAQVDVTLRAVPTHLNNSPRFTKWIPAIGFTLPWAQAAS